MKTVNKKHTLLACLIATLLLSASFSFLPIPSPKKKYAVLISQPNHMKAAVLTTETMTAESPFQRDSFVVIACGNAVNAFTKESDFAPFIQKGSDNGIHFVVCGLSLQQLKLEPSVLSEHVDVVPNGLTYLFELKRRAFTTVEL